MIKVDTMVIEPLLFPISNPLGPKLKISRYSSMILKNINSHFLGHLHLQVL